MLEISWNSAWALPKFRKLFISGSVILSAVLYFYPYFFDFVQHRQGVVLHDWLLASLPSRDVSGYIFLLICVSVGIGLIRTLQSPYLFLIFLWGYLLLNLSRLITITLVPLEPPIGLLSLADPIAFPFYGQNGITKDLFYSGHTGTLYLVFLVVKKRWEKVVTLFCTVAIAVLLLIQHIHYSLDVSVAPLFVYGLYLIAKKIVLASFQSEMKTSLVLERRRRIKRREILSR